MAGSSVVASIQAPKVVRNLETSSSVDASIAYKKKESIISFYYSTLKILLILPLHETLRTKSRGKEIWDGKAH